MECMVEPAVFSASSAETNGDVVATRKTSQKKRLVDHTLVAWSIENFSIICISLAVTWVKSRVFPPTVDRRRFYRIFLNAIIGGFVCIEGSLVVQKFLIDKVYAHVPYFSEAGRKQSQQSLWKTFKEWSGCNLVTHAISCSLIGWLDLHAPEDLYKIRVHRPTYRCIPHHFLGKLAVLRISADIAFYWIHRALHSKYLYPLHKRHHEHNSTALNTNFHFSWADLILEGFYPILFGIIVLESLKMKLMSGLEESLLVTYYQWYEIGSHSGKPVPTVTLFPPLAPLYNYFLGNVDRRNVEFHDQHHALRNCNYGISQWLDHLMGTAKFSSDKLQKKD